MKYITEQLIGAPGQGSQIAVREDFNPGAGGFIPCLSLWSYAHNTFITFDPTTGAMSFTQTVAGWNEQVKAAGGAYIALPGVTPQMEFTDPGFAYGRYDTGS